MESVEPSATPRPPNHLRISTNFHADLPAAVCQTYVVQAGDSIASISEMFSVSQGARGWFGAAHVDRPPCPLPQVVFHLQTRTPGGLRPPAPTDSPSRPPARRADALQEALGKCIIGYTPDVFLQPSQTICLPTWYDACRYVSISGELPPAVAGWGGGCKPRLLGCLLPAGHLQPGGCASQCLQCTAPPRTCGRPSCFRPPTATPRG